MDFSPGAAGSGVWRERFQREGEQSTQSSRSERSSAGEEEAGKAHQEGQPEFLRSGLAPSPS